MTYLPTYIHYIRCFFTCHYARLCPLSSLSIVFFVECEVPQIAIDMPTLQVEDVQRPFLEWRMLLIGMIRRLENYPLQNEMFAMPGARPLLPSTSFRIRSWVAQSLELVIFMYSVLTKATMMTAAGAFLVAVALVGLPSTLAFASPRTTRARTTTSSYLYMSSSALIVQNKGGGHGELGYQLAKNLSTNPKISSITILQDSAASMSKEPFASYSSDLPNVKIIMADLNNDSMTAEDMSSLLDGTAYDYIWDNSSKGDVGAGKAVIDCAAKIWKSKLLAYVSSAGIYKSNGVVSYLLLHCIMTKQLTNHHLTTPPLSKKSSSQCRRQHL